MLQDLFDSSSSELTYNDMEQDLSIDEGVNGTPYWTGVPLASLTTVPGDGVRDQYPSVTPSHSHTVCVNLPLPTQGCPTPNPARLRDVWDDKHVRMPWSKENLYPVEVMGFNNLSSGCPFILPNFRMKMDRK